MIFYLLGLLSYYKLANKPVPASICLIFFAVVTVPPATTLFLLINNHWVFRLLAFAGGLFCWTFIEYFAHRFLMHKKESKSYHKCHHFHHHKNPGIIFTNSVKRMLFLSAAVIALWSSIFFSNYLFLPAGILMGFAFYGYMHVWLHKSWASKWIGGLQHFHMCHHFGQTEKCFGVTVTWWDKIFNTIGEGKKNIGTKTIDLYFGVTEGQSLITHKQAI